MSRNSEIRAMLLDMAEKLQELDREPIEIWGYMNDNGHCLGVRHSSREEAQKILDEMHAESPEDNWNEYAPVLFREVK